MGRTIFSDNVDNIHKYNIMENKWTRIQKIRDSTFSFFIPKGCFLQVKDVTYDRYDRENSSKVLNFHTNAFTLNDTVKEYQIKYSDQINLVPSQSSIHYQR